MNELAEAETVAYVSLECGQVFPEFSDLVGFESSYEGWDVLADREQKSKRGRKRKRTLDFRPSGIEGVLWSRECEDDPPPVLERDASGVCVPQVQHPGERLGF